MSATCKPRWSGCVNPTTAYASSAARTSPSCGWKHSPTRCTAATAPGCRSSASRAPPLLRQFHRTDIRRGADPERPDERDVVATRGDVVVVHREADVVHAAGLQCLVGGVGKRERTHEHDGPFAVLPRAGGLVVRRRALGALQEVAR